jgi:hypothetical protein
MGSMDVIILAVVEDKFALISGATCLKSELRYDICDAAAGGESDKSMRWGREI